MMTERKTDFFLIGGSNSGTTALSLWLRAHPEVCFSTPKGPGYFATDFENYRYIKSMDAYQGCFSEATEAHRVLGDGSTWYLYSNEAVPNILEYNPNAKFIVILRNPIEHVRSFHNTLFHQANEDLEDFETAWNSQERRRRGELIPESCMEPKFLQYGKMSAFGWQIERLFEWVDRERVLILLYDEHVATPDLTYGAALKFLGLPPDGRTEFPVAIPHLKPRSWTLSRWALRPSRLRSSVGRGLRRVLNVESLGVTNLLRKLNYVTHERRPVTDELRMKLAAHFAGDIRQLSILIGKELEFWINPEGGDKIDV